MICPSCNGEGFAVVFGRPREDVLCGTCLGEGIVEPDPDEEQRGTACTPGCGWCGACS